MRLAGNLLETDTRLCLRVPFTMNRSRTPYPLAPLLALLALLSSPSLQGQNVVLTGVLREVFSNIGGSTLADLTANASFPSKPSLETIEPLFEAPSQFGDNYGTRMRALLIAPMSGDYVFWIASDDQGALYLSTDDTPSRRRVIAQVPEWTNPREWTKFTSQKSNPITLEEGRNYYIEALQKEGGGGDHLAVRWQLPSGQILEPIDATHLRPYGLEAPVITTRPANATAVEFSVAAFTVQLKSYLNASFQWQRDGVDLPGATNLIYQTPPVRVRDQGAVFRVRVTNSQGETLSAGAQLNVTRDVTPPRLVSVSNQVANDALVVTFSEPVDSVTAGRVGNYGLDRGAQVLNAAVSEDGLTVLLQTTPLDWDVSYVLTAQDIRDRADSPNLMAAGSRLSFSLLLEPMDMSRLRPAPEPLGPSTRRGGLVLSEIMYHPGKRADGLNLEFIELYNSQAWFADIGGFSIHGAVDYTFPAGTTIPARGLIVLAASPEAVQKVYGITGVLGYKGTLPNDKGNLRIEHRSGAVLWETDYADDAPWPLAADGAGHSLVLGNPSYGQRDARAWRASATPGGSPGAVEPPVSDAFRTLIINEVLALEPGKRGGFVELYNYSTNAVPLDGLALTDDLSTNRWTASAGSMIAERARLVVDLAEHGFAFDARGGTLWLRDAASGRVIDALRVGGFPSAYAYGRSPDGSPELSWLSTPTPGALNALAVRPEVVINEIFYDPPSENKDDEFVELHNRGAVEAAIGGWRLGGDISFEFPAGTVIPARGYLAVARDQQRLRLNHRALTPANCIGDFSGSLRNQRAQLILLQPRELQVPSTTDLSKTERVFVAVDRVDYSAGGRWGQWSAGGGSSLELLDARSGGTHAPSWADSDESRKSEWVTLQTTGLLDNGSGSADSLQVFLMGAGECLIDDVQVSLQGSTNVIANATFDVGTTGWTPQGNQVYTTWSPNGGTGGSGCLWLRATGRGDTGANRVRVPLTRTLPINQTATIRARVRWLRGSSFLLMRLHGNWLEASGRIRTTDDLGTPGEVNSRAVLNAPPVIEDVTHSPVLPALRQPITVSARARDVDGLRSLTLKYRIDPAPAYTTVVMQNRGAGYFTGVIPGQTVAGLVAFVIEASDQATNSATATFPADAPARECLVRVGEPAGKANFGVYRFWFTKDTQNRWIKRQQLSNDPLDATFVYGDSRVVYNIGALYSGSPYHSPGYNSPVGNYSDYALVFPADEPFLSEFDVSLVEPGNGCCEGSLQREATAYWLAEQLGQPFNYTRPVQVYVNGLQRAPIMMMDTQQPNSDFIDQWYPSAPKGDLHKIQLWFEFDSNASTFQPIGADFGNWQSGGTKKLARYRWNWARRSALNDINNYTNLFALHDTMLTPVGNANYTRIVSEGVDVDNWLRIVLVEHMVGNNDSFAYGGGQNMFVYKPQDEPWKMLIWDIDFAFSSESADASIFNFGGGALNTFMNHQPFRRALYRAIKEAVDGPLSPDRYTPMLDAKYQALRTVSTSVETPTSIKTYLARRRSNLQTVLNRAVAEFRITSAPTVTTSTGVASISGVAPISVTSILVDGETWPVSWTSLTNFTLRVSLPPGSKEVTVAAFDGLGKQVGTNSAAITLNSLAKPDPAIGKLFINEWMSSNKRTLMDPVDGSFDDWIELYNADAAAFNLGGYYLGNDPQDRTRWAFPSGTSIRGRGYLLVRADGQTTVSLPTNLHANFKLSKDGEYLGLFSPQGLEVDSVNFLPQGDDGSSGRFPDGAETIGHLSIPTPAASNTGLSRVVRPQIRSALDPVSGGLVLEWFGDTDAAYRIEFKDHVNDTEWTPMDGGVRGAGEVLRKNLPRPEVGQRFYRLIAE